MNKTWEMEMNAPGVVASLGEDVRATFIMKTYMHLVAAIVGFVAIEVVMFKTGVAESVAAALSSMPWLVVLGGFMLVGWMASRTAHRVESLPIQYLALFGFVLLEAIIFVPLLYIAQFYSTDDMGMGGGVIGSAAMVTLAGFAALTVVAFVTRKDFSFLRSVLMWAGMCALLAIVGGVIFNFALGFWFSLGMVAFAGAAVLYDTSNILHHYPEDRYVGAALQLFSSVAMMFYYVLMLFLSRR